MVADRKADATRLDGSDRPRGEKDGDRAGELICGAEGAAGAFGWTGRRSREIHDIRLEGLGYEKMEERREENLNDPVDDD